MSVVINDANLQFNSTLYKRKSTTAIILHHAAGTGSVKDEHDYHKNVNGWAGIGYNFYIRLDGSVWKGRGWEYVGAHAGAESGYNGKSIGICFEGNYETILTEMPSVQYNAGVELIKTALDKYPYIKEIKGHKEVYATVCPGKYFPLKSLKAVTKDTDIAIDNSAFLKALDVLVFDKVIGTRQYWENAITNHINVNGEFLSTVIQKMTNKPTLLKGVSRLVEVGVVSSPEYWMNNCIPGRTCEIDYVKKIFIDGVKMLKL